MLFNFLANPLDRCLLRRNSGGDFRCFAHRYACRLRFQRPFGLLADTFTPEQFRAFLWWGKIDLITHGRRDFGWRLYFGAKSCSCNLSKLLFTEQFTDGDNILRAGKYNLARIFHELNIRYTFRLFFFDELNDRFVDLSSFSSSLFWNLNGSGRLSGWSLFHWRFFGFRFPQGFLELRDLLFQCFAFLGCTLQRIKLRFTLEELRDRIVRAYMGRVFLHRKLEIRDAVLYRMIVPNRIPHDFPVSFSGVHLRAGQILLLPPDVHPRLQRNIGILPEPRGNLTYGLLDRSRVFRLHLFDDSPEFDEECWIRFGTFALPRRHKTESRPCGSGDCKGDSLSQEIVASHFTAEDCRSLSGKRGPDRLAFNESLPESRYALLEHFTDESVPGRALLEPRKSLRDAPAWVDPEPPMKNEPLERGSRTCHKKTRELRKVLDPLRPERPRKGRHEAVLIVRENRL